MLLPYRVKETVSGPFTAEGTSLSGVGISQAAPQLNNFNPLMKEYDLVKQIAVLLTNKKGKSPICSFTAPDETTHDEE